MKKTVSALMGLTWALLLLSSCNPKVTTSISKAYPPLGAPEDVKVYMPDEELPAGGALIGTVKVGDSGWSLNCGYNQVMSDAIRRTSLSGGNALKITSHQLPNTQTTCHTIEGGMYRFEPETLAMLESTADSTVEQRDYAKLKVYRYPANYGPRAITLTMDGKDYAYVPEQFKSTFLFKEPGERTFQTDPPMPDPVVINFEAGREYYIECFAEKGMDRSIPMIKLQNEGDGKYAYESMIAKHTGSGERFAPVFGAIRISLSGGYGYRLGEVDDSNQEYEEILRKLKHGFDLTADLGIYFSPSSGLGFRYQSFHASAYSENIGLELPKQGWQRGEFSEKAQLRYIGPYFSMRTGNAQSKHLLFSNVGIGYVDFLSTATMGDEFSVEGNTIGVLLELGYDYLLTDHVALGLQASFYGASLTEVTWRNGSWTNNIELPDDQPISASHLSLSAGLRLYF